MFNRKLFLSVLILSFLIVVSGCAKHPKIMRDRLTINAADLKNKINQQTAEKAADTITIWVHGTRTLTRYFMHNYFYRPDGMACATEIDPHYHLREIAEALSNDNPTEYPLENIYFFGWSGKLSFAERKKASKDLAIAIDKLIAAYKEKHDTTPKIRIITHSHGGNVVLNMAKIKDKITFTVDELILLACPVQEQTEQCIANPLFKENFALYSAFDLLQVIDPQGLYKHSHKQKYPLFSHRCFRDQANLTQVKMKLNKRAMMHVDFIRTKFVACLPSVIEKLHAWHEKIEEEQLNKPEISHLLSVHVRA